MKTLQMRFFEKTEGHTLVMAVEGSALGEVDYHVILFDNLEDRNERLKNEYYTRKILDKMDAKKILQESRTIKYSDKPQHFSLTPKSTTEITSLVNKLLIESRGNFALYIGAGLSKLSGIWDLNELNTALLSASLKELKYDLRDGGKCLKKNYLFFLHALQYSKPCSIHKTISRLQSKYNFPILTENRDNLLQKSGCKVIGREIVGLYPFVPDNLVVIGMSSDHQGFISFCRKRGCQILVLDKSRPNFAEENDVWIQVDLEKLDNFLEEKD